MANQEKPPLLALPAEIRESIYRFLLNPDANRVFGPDEYNDYNYRDSLVLFRLNQQIYVSKPPYYLSPSPACLGSTLHVDYLARDFRDKAIDPGSTPASSTETNH